MDRIVLALELAGLCAAEVALPLKVIDARGGVTPYEPIARAGHARRRIMAYGLGESWRPRRRRAVAVPGSAPRRVAASPERIVPPDGEVPLAALTN
jgi:hypothetical protein